MPQTGERRQNVVIRLSQAGREHIERRAIEEGLVKERNGEPQLSEMARIMLAYASQHMPKGWRPTST